MKYIENVSIAEDVRIIFETVKKAFIKQEGITQDDMATAEDFGDYLLRTDQVSLEEYDNKQEEARDILKKVKNNQNDEDRIEAVREFCVYVVI